MTISRRLITILFFLIFSNSGSQDLDNKDDMDSGDELDGKKLDADEVDHDYYIMKRKMKPNEVIWVPRSYPLDTHA